MCRPEARSHHPHACLSRGLVGGDGSPTGLVVPAMLPRGRGHEGLGRGRGTADRSLTVVICLTHAATHLESIELNRRTVPRAQVTLDEFPGTGDRTVISQGNCCRPSPPTRLLLRLPPPPVAPRAQLVVSALVLFDPATGCYHYFTLISDGACTPPSLFIRFLLVCPPGPPHADDCRH